MGEDSCLGREVVGYVDDIRHQVRVKEAAHFVELVYQKEQTAQHKSCTIPLRDTVFYVQILILLVPKYKIIDSSRL